MDKSLENPEETPEQESQETPKQETEEQPPAGTEAPPASAGPEAPTPEIIKPTSSSESGVSDKLLKNFHLLNQRVEQEAALSERTRQEMSQLMTEMKATMDLHQEQIANMADSAEAVTTAAAALVKLHQEQKKN